MKYSKAMGLDLHLTDYTQMKWAHMLPPPFVFMMVLYALDEVATMEVANRKIATDDNSKLIYFVEADDGSGVALLGDRGPSGVRGLKGDSGSQGPNGKQGPAGKQGAEGSGGPPGKIGKIGPPGPVGGKGSVGEGDEKGEKGDAGDAGLGTKGNTCP